MFKKLLLSIVMLFSFVLQNRAQTITKYTFSAYSGTFTNISGATSPALSAGNTDEGYTNAIPLGFDFWYMGTRYTTVSVSTNGWLTLGANITAATPVNSLSSGGAPRPIIAPLWDDLELSPATKLSYVTTGSTGSRIFTIQCQNIRWTISATGNTISTQVKLYEGTGKIEFLYRQESGSVSSPSASIGIAAAATGSGNFLSVSNSGTSASSTTEANVTSKPITGNTYAFTPPVPTAPASLIFSGVTSTSTTLNWSDLSSNEIGFVIYRSTDGINYTFVSQTTANVTSSIQSGLTASTTYYWRVYAVSEGGLSTALSGTQATPCTPPGPPTVTSPVAYCQGATATALTATGSNLLWGGTSGSVGGNTALSTSTVYVEPLFNNRKTTFTTLVSNVTITTVDYYIPAYQSVLGLVLSIYNSSGTIIATSATSTSISAGAAVVKVSNTFNFAIATAGDYSIGVSSGAGNIGADNPAFPITESTNTIRVTGVSTTGNRCFNNIQFTTPSSSTAPTPSTAAVGSANYLVTQTVGGCQSATATITVNVTTPNLSQIPTSSLLANYKFSGNALDATGTLNGTLQNSPTLVANRFGIASSAYSFNGSSQYMSTSTSYANPGNFTISIWFKTSTVTGGRLIGFGTSATGLSGQYDRHLYMNNAGQIYFGVYPNAVQTLNSTASYNDNAWHLATATLSGTDGMALYVDGVLLGTNAAITSAENYTGYWRIGYDNNNGWTSQPSSFYFSGVLDDALIYQRALNAGEVAALYNSPEGAGNNGPACIGSSITLTAITLSGATYAWTGPNSFSSSSQNPTFTYAAANAGTYTVQVTSGGCTASAYTNVATNTTSTGQWTGGVSTDWATAANWCTGVVPTSTTDVVISSTATRMPTISTSVTCRNLTINAGATLTTALAGTLNITGTLSNSGTMVNNGTTNFNGISGQQTFSGVASFYNLTLSNSSGLLLPATTAVTNNLTLTSGTLVGNNFGLTVGGNWINNVSTSAFTPGTATVTFNGTGAQTIGGSFATTFNNLTISKASNTATLNVNANVGGNLTITSGTFDLGSFTANRATAGGALTVANNATLKIGGTNTYPVNYTSNLLSVASTVEYSGTNQTVANQTYGNLTLSSASGAAVKTFPATALAIVGNLTSTLGAGTSVTFTAASALTISGNVSIGASTTFNSGSFSHSIGGNWTTSGTFNGNAGTVTFIGPGSVVSGSGTANFNNLTISASQISFTATAITVTGNLATVSSGSFSQASGGTLTMTGAGKTISGSGIVLDNLTVSGDVSTNSSFDLSGNLSVSGTFTSTFGTITMSGTSKTISGTGSKTFKNLLISGSITTAVDFTISSNLSVSGSFSASAGTATFTGSTSLSGTANLFNVVVTSSSLQLSANAVLGIANTLTFAGGTLNVTSSVPNTVNFNGTGAQNINPVTYNNLILSNGNNKTATSSLTVNNSITIGTGTTFVPGAFTHYVHNDWINNGTFTAGSSTIEFIGTATSNIRGATTFNILTVNQSTMATQVVLESNVSAGTVNMTNGMVLTGANTLTITGTRNGTGKILGTINRTHSFTTGVSYAFKSPENTITFSAVSSVTSVIVTTSEAQVSDFPFGGSVNEEYTIAVPAGTYTATLRLAYDDAGLNGNNESTMGLWNYNGSVWVSIGKTGNNTTSNYVEQSGLTNITNRWTLSDQANRVQWNGSVSSDWHTAANWTVVQGSASRPPGAADIADLGTVAFTNQPTINAAALAKNIHFGSAQAVTLTLASGGSLTSGNIDGDWSTGRTHTIQVNSQTLTVNGDLNLSDGTNGHNINLAIGSGTVDISGSLLQSGNASVTFSGAGTLNVYSDFDHVNGTFSAGSGTVVYDGNENQHIAHLSYNNLTINKVAGIALIDSIVSIAGNLLITSGQLDNTSTTTIMGNVTISSGTTFINTGILHVGGNWANSGSYLGQGTGVIFDGSGTQTISATTFNNLTINKPVGSSAVLTGNIVLNGDLTVTSGTFNIGTFNCNRSVQGGTLTLAGLATFIVSANNSPLNFSNGIVATTSTVIADGTVPQFIFGVEFGNLVFRNAGLKTLVSPILVKGDLVIESGATFDGSSETLTLEGHWLNSGTFVPSSSTIVCNGTTKNISGNTTFNRLTVYGSYTILNDVTFNGLLNITATGSLSGGPSIHTTMNGDLINSGILYTLGTTTFTGQVLQTLSLINSVQTVAITVNFNGFVSPVLNSTSAPQYGYLNINNTGGVNPSVGWTIAYALTVGTGASFNGGTSTHNLLGSLTNNGTITSSGTFNFIPGSAAIVNFGSNFSSTGTVVLGGAGAMALAGTPLSFRNVQITNTNVAGITPSSNWSLANNFTINAGSVFNASSYTYSVAGRLTNRGTMNSGTSTFILNGTATQEILSASAFNNLTINKASASAVLSSDVTVNGALNFTSGKIQTDDYLLIQPSTGTVTGAAQNTGWVNGKLKKSVGTGATAKTFEIGDASYYTPVSVSFSSVTTAGDLTAFTTTGDHPILSNSTINPAKSVNRFWTIDNAGVVFTNYTATLNFAASDIDGGAATAAFKVGLYDGNSWILPGTASPNPTSIQATGITAMGDFAIGEICNTGTSIAYLASPFCSNAGTASVALTGTSGGTFSSDAGLSLNGTTGAVNLSASTGGTYGVTYTVAAAGGCPVFITSANITVTSAPSATIAYSNDSLCSSSEVAPITLIGTTGGSFSSSSGLIINASTGTVDLLTSTPGSYTVTYLVNAAAGCASYSTTTGLTVTLQPFATGTYEGNPYCSNGGIAFPTGSAVGLPGTLTSTAGLSIDPPTGVVDLAASTPGIYTVIYTVPAHGGCALYSNTATVAITAAPFAIFSYAGSPYTLNQGTASVTFSGTTGGTYSSTAGLTLNSSSGSVTLGTSTPDTYIVTYAVPAADGCAAFDTMASITITFNPKTWDGGAGTSLWSNGVNWDPDGVPTFSDNITLSGPFTINADVAGTVRDLTLNHAGLTLTINTGNSLAIAGNYTQITGTLNTGSSGNQNMTVAGNWTKNGGTFTANANTVAFTGTATQSIAGSSPTTFHGISVTNTASPGVRIESSQNMTGVLTLAGNTVFDADGSGNNSVFKLISSGDNPTQDAGIGTLPSGAQVSGNVTVQRFMAKEGRNSTRIYRYISSPVQNAPVSDIQNEIPVTGSFTGASTCSGCLTNQTLFYYNESVLTDINGSGTADYNDGYIDFPDASNTETLIPGRGYTLFVRGNILASTLWDVRGPVNKGNVSLPVSYTSSGNVLNDGWNLVGNPYPSTIDWNSSGGWTKTNVDASIYISDNGNGSNPLQYATWNGVTGTNGGSRYIAVGQGFWTKANASVPVLQSNENVKAPGVQTTFFRQESVENLIRITMSGGAVKDEAVIHFRTDATAGFNPGADAWKLKNESFNLSSLTDSSKLVAINSWTELICNTAVKLSISEAAAGSYSLKFTDLDSFEEGVQVVLKDNFLNTSTSVFNNVTYAFSVTGDVKSSGKDRFVLQFTKTAPEITIQEKDRELSISYQENIQWYLNNRAIEGANSSKIKRESAGTYSVTVNYKGCVLKGSTNQIITAGDDQTSLSGLTIFPNPVENEVFIVPGENTIQSITLTDPLGEKISEVRFNGNDGHQKVRFAMADNASGVYFLKIFSDGKVHVKKIIKD